MGRRLEPECGDGNSWQCIALQQRTARLQTGGRNSPRSRAGPYHIRFSPLLLFTVIPWLG